MKLRVVSIAMVLGLGLLATAPLAAAQIEFAIEWSHPTMELPETGRGDMPVAVKAYLTNAACGPGATITADLKLGSFAKWAGASMEPLSATWVIPQGPTTAKTELAPTAESSEIILNFAWDVDGRPATGATQDYVLSTQAKSIDGGPCLPDPQRIDAKSTPMTATMPDKPPVANMTTAVDCQSDPFNPACANAGTTAAAESPAIDAGLLLGVLAAFAVVFRRRRA